MKIILQVGLLVLGLNVAAYSWSGVCDNPVERYCASAAKRVCSLAEDTFERVRRSIPCPPFAPCPTEYIDRLVPGERTCRDVATLDCSGAGPRSIPSACRNLHALVEDCIIDGSSAQCKDAVSTAAKADLFSDTCKVIAIHQANTFGAPGRNDLGDLVSKTLTNNQLYDHIDEIFGGLLGDSGFADYVRGTVKHYEVHPSVFDIGLVDVEGEEIGKAFLGEIYYNVENPSASLIIHELVHQWQMRKEGLPAKFDDVCSETVDLIANGQQLGDAYLFSLDETNTLPFDSFLTEQQAEIIEIYYGYKYEGRVGCFNDNFVNCDDFGSDSERMNALKKVIASEKSSGGSSSSSGPLSPGQVYVQTGSFGNSIANGCTWRTAERTSSYVKDILSCGIDIIEKVTINVGSSWACNAIIPNVDNVRIETRPGPYSYCASFRVTGK